MLAAAKGYKSIIVMPQVPPMYERYITCRKFGAEVHLTTVMKDDMDKTVKYFLDYARELVESNPDYWAPLQFESDDNAKIHYEVTGPEIWDQTDGEVDCFVAGAGTGGTLCAAPPQFLTRGAFLPCSAFALCLVPPCTRLTGVRIGVASGTAWGATSRRRSPSA
eukprot:94012-Prymnesium_polylepis.1